MFFQSIIRTYFIKLCTIFITTVSAFNCTLQASNITPVMRHNLDAYTWQDEDWPNEPFGEYLDRCLRYQKNLQPFKKCRAAWNILDRYYENENENSLNNFVIGNDISTWENLQLLRGEKDDLSCYVAQLVDRTSTEIGRVTLRSWIAQPTSNYHVLNQRQDNVKYLTEKNELFQILDNLLREVEESENFLLSFWLNDPLKQASQRQYFKFSRAKSIENTINTNPSFLTTSAIFEHKKRILTLATTAFAAAVLPMYGIKCLFKNEPIPTFDKLAQRLIGSGGPVFSLMSFIENTQVQAAGFIAAGMYCGLRGQEEFDWIKDNFTLSIYLQKKLYHVAHCLHTIQAIGDVLHAHPDIILSTHNDILTHFKKLKEPGSRTQQLLELLESETFKNEGSVFAKYGNILVAYHLMHECIGELEPLLCTLGELDVYMSNARLYKEFEYNRVRYNFVSYDIEHMTPKIIVQDLWNPFIDPSIVVPNSIELGTTENPTNLIVTGPNEGGKSTFVKSVAIGVILAQSIGIVPARKGIITPFSYIGTYLNITDDHGKSLFEAQVQRAKHILDHIDAIEKNKYSFVIIDELFNGTQAQVGQAASYSISDYLSKKSNVISIFPTHFPMLTLLEKDGLSVNYKVCANIDESGNIQYPFLLEKGFSEQNIVLDIMRQEGFNPVILDKAAQLLAS